MELNEIKQTVDNQSLEVQQIVNSIIGDKLEQLDNYISGVKQSLLSSIDIPNGDLDKIVLQIPVYLYYLTTIVQELEIRKGVSAEDAKYNENDYLLQATGTVVEKQSKAANAAIKDRVIQLAYKSAASLVQSKINGAMEILNSCRKIQARRMEESRLTRTAGDAVGGF